MPFCDKHAHCVIMWQIHFVFLCYEHTQEQSICILINQTNVISFNAIKYLPFNMSCASDSPPSPFLCSQHIFSPFTFTFTDTSGTNNTDGPCAPPPPHPPNPEQLGTRMDLLNSQSKSPAWRLHLKGFKPPHLNKLFCFLYAFSSFPLTCLYLSHYVQQAMQKLTACRLAAYRGRQGSRSSNWILMSCQPHRVTSGQSNSGGRQRQVLKVASRKKKKQAVETKKKYITSHAITDLWFCRNSFFSSRHVSVSRSAKHNCYKKKNFGTMTINHHHRHHHHNQCVISSRCSRSSGEWCKHHFFLRRQY